jgi:hypothetical protein
MLSGFPNNNETIPNELKYMQMIQESCLLKIGFSGVGGMFFLLFTSFLDSNLLILLYVYYNFFFLIGNT